MRNARSHDVNVTTHYQTQMVMDTRGMNGRPRPEYFRVQLPDVALSGEASRN